jgi:hypothetical protein
MMKPALRDPHHLEIIDEDRRPHTVDTTPFDRLACARRVLRVLQPTDWTVALYRREGRFYTDRVRDLRRGVTAVWATVGIPSLASREEITLVLTRRTGKRDTPYVHDVLAASDEWPRSGAGRMKNGDGSP